MKQASRQRETGSRTMSPPDGSAARQATEDFADRLRRRLIGGLRFEGHVRKQVLELLQEIEAEIISKLDRHNPVGVSQTAAQQRRLRRLLRDTRAKMRELYQELRLNAAGSLGEFAAAEAAWTQSALHRAVSGVAADLTVRVAPVAVLRTLVEDTLIVGRPLKEWWAKQEQSAFDRFVVQMRLGVAQNETVEQLIRRVRGTRAMRFQDGLMEVSRRSAEMAVRTSVNAVGNAARQAVYEANSDLITAFVHSSVLDGKTSVTCGVRDGLAWDQERTPVGHKVAFQQPPLHPNCRSVILPRIGDVRTIPGSRVSADGPVPASQTFETWIRGKTASEQNKILGVGRARMWRRNKLTLRQLLDFKGDPLTLDELQRRYSE